MLVYIFCVVKFTVSFLCSSAIKLTVCLYFVQVWSTSTCEFVRTLNGHKRGIACLQYRDRLVVSGSSDNTIRFVGINRSQCSCQTTDGVYSLCYVDIKSYIFIIFSLGYGTLSAERVCEF